MGKGSVRLVSSEGATMRILHTADWHLGDRLGGLDRTTDLRRAVEQVAALCDQQRIDVCLIAEDVFSDRHPRDQIPATIEHLAESFEEFLLRGGTVLAMSGNHDNESFWRTLKQMMRLSSPVPIRRGDVVAGGRWYLATGPSFLRLKDSAGVEVQFVLMPYPTICRYAGNEMHPVSSVGEKHRILRSAFLSRMIDIQTSSKFSSTIPTVYAAHAFVSGAMIPRRFRITENEDIVFHTGDFPSDSAYIALGHLHRPQCVAGKMHMRYSGSIERLDMGEREDSKQVVVFNIDQQGLRGDPIGVSLTSTPFYDVRIIDPQREVPHLRQRYPEAAHALVRYQVTFTPGRDNLNEILSEINRVFPRWYDRSWSRSDHFQRSRERHDMASPLVHDLEPLISPAGFHDTVIQYLRWELDGHGERQALLDLAEKILAEGPD